MAENKKSFLLYCDVIHTVGHLSNKQAGILFKHILSYVNDENPITDDVIINLTFEPIKQQLKRDLLKYENIVDRNRENGKKGGRPLTQRNPKKPTGLNNNPKKPKKADIDIDIDTVIDKDNVNVTDINILLSSATPNDVALSDVDYLEIAQAFQKLFIKNISEAGGSLIKIENAKLKTWINPIRLLIVNDKITKDKLVSVFKLLQNNKFWKKNILSTSKLRDKINQLVLESKNGEQKRSSGLSKEFIERIYGGSNGN